MKTKSFDCVEMKRSGAEHVYSMIKDMTPEQELEYWRKETKLLRESQAAIRAARPDLSVVQGSTIGAKPAS